MQYKHLTIEDILFRNFEKDGDRIAQEIKKINPGAKISIRLLNLLLGNFISP